MLRFLANKHSMYLASLGGNFYLYFEKLAVISWVKGNSRIRKDSTVLIGNVLYDEY